MALGDIHGCSLALSAVIEAIDPQPDDTLVTLGDYVNEGIDSKGDRGVQHDLPTTLRIADWTYSQIAMAHGLTWEKGRTMVPLSGDWERELRELIEKAA